MPADDADPGEGQHHLADHLPGRASRAVGGLLQHRRDREEDVAGDRGDEGQDHDRKDQAGGEDADAIGRSGEERGESRHIGEGVDQPGLQRLLEEGREDEEAPDAVNDRRDAGEQLNRRADRPARPVRAELGEEDGDADADRDADEHGDERGDHRAVDRGNGAELLGDRVPALRRDKAEAEGVQRRERNEDQGKR